jgi:hypothetical protein
MRPLYLIFLSGWLLLASACATFDPQPRHLYDYHDRAQSMIKGEVRVTVAVLTTEESKWVFGVPLADRGIQPVWLRIQNNEQVPYWVYAIGLDPNYFAPDEAAWKNHFLFSSATNADMDAYFRGANIHEFVLPEHTVSGFLFTNIDEGTKSVNVSLISPDKRERTFSFQIPVPGLETDQNRIDEESERDALYPPDAMVEIEDLDALRIWVEQLPCCVVGANDELPGDPLNLVLIGADGTVAPAFSRQGWQSVETVTTASAWKTVRAFLSGSRYKYSPVSPLYLYGRQHDFALQKARDTVNQRNHLRLWLAPAKYRGSRIWVGQISRDIGVRFTGRVSPITTHVIDPDVDEARWYLTQDLVASQRVELIALAKGVGAAAPDAPRHNLLGDPYFTDGLRLVVIFTEDSKSLDEVHLFEWETPPDLRYLKSQEVE